MQYDKYFLNENKVQIQDFFPVELKVQVQVRHVGDPLLVAKDISHNQYNFGTSARDLRVISAILFVIFVLLIVRPVVVLSEVQWIPDYQSAYIDKQA